MLRLPILFRTGSMLKFKLNKEKLMLFLYINLSIIQIFTARIGRLTSNQELVSSILSQSILSAFILYWCINKHIWSISLIVPFMTTLLFIISAFIYPDRADMILSYRDGIWNIISVGGSMMGFFIVMNIKDYTVLENIMRLSLWYQVPYFLYICIRAGKTGYWIIKVGNDTFKSSYNMEVGYGMSLVAILLIYAFYKRRNVFLLLISALFEFLIILFGSRGAMLPLIVYLMMWFFISRGESKWKAFGKKLTILVISCVVLFFIITSIDLITVYINDFFLDRLNYYSRSLMRFINGDVGNASSRIDLWKPMWKYLRENAYLPLGLYADRELVGTYSHNFIIEIISNFGMFGIGAVLYLFFQTVRFFKICTEECEKMFLCVFMSYSITRLMLSSSFWMERYFWIYLSLLVVGIRKYKTDYKVCNGVFEGELRKGGLNA